MGSEARNGSSCGRSSEVVAIEKRDVTRLLLRVELKRSILRDLLQQALRLTDSVVSIRGFDAWLQDVTSFAKDEPAPSVEMRVLGHLSSSPSSRALDTVAATLFLAKRHVRVQQVADFLAVPRRTLEFQLKVARLPVPERLLGWSTALHTMWRLDVLRWPLKRAATHADFRTSAALANYVNRHVGARPAQLSQEGGFTALLERFLTVLERSTLRVAHQRRRLLVGLRPASAVLSS